MYPRIPVIVTQILYQNAFDILKHNWQSLPMKWPRLMLLVLFSGFILVAVAIQTEKPAVLLTEMRPERFATHFRQVEFVPDSLTAWAVGFGGTVLRTDDAGETWTHQETKSTARLYGLQVFDINTAYCCGSDGTLLATGNGGKTWKKIPVTTRYRLLDVFFHQPGYRMGSWR